MSAQSFGPPGEGDHGCGASPECAQGEIQPLRASVWGGANAATRAHFRQRRPVAGAFSASDPTVVPLSLARNALDLFWGDESGNRDCIRRCAELTQLTRCEDER